MSGAVSRPPLTFRRTPPRATPQITATPDVQAAPPAAAGRSGDGKRATHALRNVTAQQVASSGLFILAGLFLLSLLVPHRFYIGGLMFQPYKFWLTILFVPLLIMFFMGKAGRPMLVDWLMIGTTLWMLLSTARNHGVGYAVVTGGSYVVEFLGAYLLARIAIRSAADFRRMVVVLFIVLLVLLPFAVLEAFSGRPVLAQWIGADWIIKWIGERMGMRRTQTAFEHPILFGAFVSTMFGLFWYALIPNATLIARLFLASLAGIATIFSLSTGAFLAVQVQILLIFWELITRPHPQRWRIFGWLVVIGYFALDQITTRTPFHTLVNYAAFSSHSAYMRIIVYEHGMAIVRANRLFGIGFHDWPRPFWVSGSVDNFWLLTAMRHGIPALAMFAAAIALIILRAGRQPMIDPLDRACRAAFLTALGGVIIAGGTVHYWRALLVFVVFIIGSGVWTFTGGARSLAGSGQENSPNESDPFLPQRLQPCADDEGMRNQPHAEDDLRPGKPRGGAGEGRHRRCGPAPLESGGKRPNWSRPISTKR